MMFRDAMRTLRLPEGLCPKAEHPKADARSRGRLSAPRPKIGCVGSVPAHGNYRGSSAGPGAPLPGGRDVARPDTPGSSRTDKVHTVTEPESAARRLVVLVSGSGSNLQALLDAAADPAYGATGGGRRGRPGRHRRAGPGRRRRRADLRRAGRGLPVPASDWDRALTAHVAAHQPDLVISAGFLKLVGPALPGRVRRPLPQHPQHPAAGVPGHPRPARRARLRREGHRRHPLLRRRRRGHRADRRAGRRTGPRRRRRGDAHRAHQGSRATPARRAGRAAGPRRLDDHRKKGHIP